MGFTNKLVLKGKNDANNNRMKNKQKPKD